jgi:mannose-1-phosphate guanylyltransferase
VSHFENLHVIIQADGSDQRLSSLCQVLSGTDVPKQFALIAAGGSLLQHAVARFVPLVSERRMVVVVPAAYEELARTQLQAWRGVEIIARPGERPDFLLPLGRVLARDPQADVVVVPAEHYVPRPEPVRRAVETAAAGLRDVPAVVLGAVADRRTLTSTWIVPGRALGQSLNSVAGFVNHPTAAHAERLLVAGALWNTAIVVASGSYLWRAAGQRSSQSLINLWAGGDVSHRALAAAYEQMPKAELDPGYLGGLCELAVVRMAGSGWTDWSSPEHVIDSLQQPGELESLLSRIFWRQQACGPRLPRGERRGGSGLHATAA